jgi:hypothetical protein
VATALASPPQAGTAAVHSSDGIRRSGFALAAVGLLFLLVQLVLVPRPLGFSTDEATYLAMTDPRVPELYWTPPRAWGMPILAAPVTLVSAGLQATRLYFALLSSALLVAAFWPWRRVLHPAVAPVAALLFSTTWVTIYFGSLVMPNLYVAFGVLGAIGMFYRATQDPAWWRVLLTGLAASLVAVVRPTDSVLVLGTVFLGSLLVPRLRRFGPLAALPVGVAIGWLPWIVEAFLRFGGPIKRLGSAEEAGPKGLGLDWSRLSIVPRLLDGTPTYCCSGGPASEAGPLPLLLTLWLIAIPVLAVVGLVLAARHGRLAELALVFVPAGLLGAFYVLLPSFTTLRFLLPVLALLSLPLAAALVALLTSTTGAARTVVVAVLALGLVGHLGLMLPKAESVLSQNARTRSLELRMARALQPLVEGRPCMIAGTARRTTGYYLGCDIYSGRPKVRTPRRVREAEAAGVYVVWVIDRKLPPDTTISSWPQVKVPGMPKRWKVYLPPS